MRYTRDQVKERIAREVARGKPIVGAGAGTGISAKFAEAGGADLIIIYNSGRYRMAGHGSLAGLLAFGDANQIVKEMGEREVLPVVREAPVIAGVMGTDPMRQMSYLLRELDALGFSGVNNFPTVGLIDGKFRMELERTNMGFGKEIDMIRQAHDLGFYTAVYVFNPDESRAMAQAGADCVIA
ncbi:MAG TPA: phosphoenolpyruvate hydrolase family protein, partial [Thermomicrobiales bacterium]|nr:phosphoenolpyruvate hydrolase family protein [Thermomicrobiales bacterium]